MTREKRDRPGQPWEAGIEKNKKYYDRSQYVIENTGRHVQNELKRTQNEPRLDAEKGASCVEFELSETSHVLAKAANGKRDRGAKPARRGNPGDCEKIRKSRERSQGVLENKGHHFFQCCKLGAFCARIRSNLTPKGAKRGTFCENEGRIWHSRSDAVKVTNSR